MTATRAGIPTIDLARFLLARVDEEEQALRALVRRTRRAGDRDRDGFFIHAHRDLLAKRQVLGHVQHLLVLRDLPSEKIVRDLATSMLQSMAEPYVDHHHYRRAWSQATPVQLVDAAEAPGAGGSG